MPSPSRAATTAATLLLALTLTAGATAAPGDGGSVPPPQRIADVERPATRALADALTSTSPREEPPQTFIGLDGATHTVSDVAIPGKDGYLYIGSDFDTACAFGGRLRLALRGLSRLADLLEESGRRALFTVPPNKSVVMTSTLPDPVPQGECSRRGMRVQSKMLDTYKDERYIPLRAALARTPRSYWRTDSHWNTIGATVLAKRLARALDPRLARQQNYSRQSRTHRGDLSYYIPGTGEETARGKVPDNGVVTVPVQGSAAYDPSLKEVFTELAWRSSPKKRTYPGDTLIIGDSFNYVATEAVTNLFRRGRFMWLGFQTQEELNAALAGADTVIFSVVQRFATISALADPQFQDQLSAALRKHDKARR